MVTGSKGSTKVMLVMEWVVGFVMDFDMTKVVIRGWRSSSYLSNQATNLYSVFWRWSLGPRAILT